MAERMWVPGSPFLTNGQGGLNHLFHWWVKVREKTGARHTFNYWFNCNFGSRMDVAAYIHRFYRNVQVLEIARCTKMPERPLFPIPAHHYQFGLLPQDEEVDPDEQVVQAWGERDEDKGAKAWGTGKGGGWGQVTTQGNGFQVAVAKVGW